MKNFLLWLLTLFMFASAIFFIPSAASVLLLLFAAICGLNGWVKAVLLAVLFALCVKMVPA